MADNAQTRRKAVITRERDVRTYAVLWSASAKVLEAGIREPKGSSWQFLASAVLTAFAFEAYLNHVGPKVLSSWESLEQLPPIAKLELLCEVLKVQLPTSKGERPMQTIITLLKFRNTLAHGRTVVIRPDSIFIDADKIDDHFSQRLLTHWERLVKTSDFAMRVREDVGAILKLVHAEVPPPKENLFAWGYETGSAAIQD